MAPVYQRSKSPHTLRPDLELSHAPRMPAAIAGQIRFDFSTCSGAERWAGSEADRARRVTSAIVPAPTAIEARSAVIGFLEMKAIRPPLVLLAAASGVSSIRSSGACGPVF